MFRNQLGKAEIGQSIEVYTASQGSMQSENMSGFALRPGQIESKYFQTFFQLGDGRQHVSQRDDNGYWFALDMTVMDGKGHIINTRVAIANCDLSLSLEPPTPSTITSGLLEIDLLKSIGYRR